MSQALLRGGNRGRFHLQQAPPDRIHSNVTLVVVVVYDPSTPATQVPYSGVLSYYTCPGLTADADCSGNGLCEEVILVLSLADAHTNLVRFGMGLRIRW